MISNMGGKIQTKNMLRINYRNTDCNKNIYLVKLNQINIEKLGLQNPSGNKKTTVLVYCLYK